MTFGSLERRPIVAEFNGQVLQHTELANARVGTIRTQLLKVGALILGCFTLHGPSNKGATGPSLAD